MLESESMNAYQNIWKQKISMIIKKYIQRKENCWENTQKISTI